MPGRSPTRFPAFAVADAAMPPQCHRLGPEWKLGRVLTSKTEKLREAPGAVAGSDRGGPVSQLPKNT